MTGRVGAGAAGRASGEVSRTTAGTLPETPSVVWPSIAALALVAATWMAWAGLGVAWVSAAPAALMGIGLELLAVFYRRRRPDPKLSAALSAMAQLVAASAAGAALSYAAAATAGDLRDETLYGWDRALGLDWRAYLAFVDAHPRLWLVYTLAYRSLLLQFLVVVLGLGFTGRLRQLRAFVLAFVMALTVTVVISGLLPAVAMFVHLKLGPRDFGHIQPAAAFVHMGILSGLRDGTLRTVAIGSAEGIITFPSFHAALGVMFALALWPVRLLRWPALALNAVLIAATPIDGGHYFVDVLAGGVIGASAMVAARSLGRRAVPKEKPRGAAAGLGA